MTAALRVTHAAAAGTDAATPLLTALTAAAAAAGAIEITMRTEITLGPRGIPDYRSGDE